MKIAVYAIALNEAKHVERWFESAKNADELVILDTGSDDDTVKIAERLGINVAKEVFDPFDFAKARNAALALVSSDVDYCITLDLDEVLHDGWRKAFDTIDPRITRPRYHYVFQRDKNGHEVYTYRGHGTHARHGYEWQGSIHESITPLKTEIQGFVDYTIEHKPDSSKSREQYLPMLRKAYESDPDDARVCYYFGRELMYRSEKEEAILVLTKRIQMNDTHVGERSFAMRYLATLDEPNKESWLLRSAAEMPWVREGWVDLAQYYYTKENWPLCYAMAKKALSIVDKPEGWFNESHAWNANPHDLLALGAYNIGLFDEAVKHGEIACELNSSDQRLVDNLVWYRKAIGAVHSKNA